MKVMIEFDGGSIVGKENFSVHFSGLWLLDHEFIRGRLRTEQEGLEFFKLVLALIRQVMNSPSNS